MQNAEGRQATGESGKNVTRRVTPAGFILALLLFLFLPFAAASCDVPADSSTAAGTIGMSLTGADLIASRERLDTTGGLALTPAQQSRATAGFHMTRVVQILAILAAAAMVVGAATAVARTVRVRAAAAVVAAGGAIAVLAVTEYLTVERLTEMAEYVLLLGTYLPQVEGKNLDGRIGEVVHIGLGFWLAVALLVLIIAVNVVVLVASRRRSSSGLS